jgi:hypothetical protein
MNGYREDRALIQKVAAEDNRNVPPTPPLRRRLGQGAARGARLTNHIVPVPDICRFR